MATIRRPDDDQDSLVHRADTFLYEAKGSGRNRMCHGADVAERPSRPDPLLSTARYGVA